MSRPLLSIILATCDRCRVLRGTLDRIHACGLARDEYEILVVDNASRDGTSELLARRDDVMTIRAPRNLGACAKALALEAARGEFLLLLDDDSWPRPGCVPRMLEAFAGDASLAAAGFTVHLPDGSQECSALPHVFVGCGVGLRARAVREVGGLDLSLYMGAEEYDLAFRLLQRGWSVEILADLEVEHLKSPEGRRPQRLHYFDVRNNLRLVARYLPGPYARVYARDWVQRYRWIAQRHAALRFFRRGLWAGRWLALRERWSYRPWRLGPGALEDLFSWRHVQRRMAALREAGMRCVLLADCGKNVYAFWRGARRAGLTVVAIADDTLAAPGRTYRGLPILPLDLALHLDADAVVVSNTSYVHATAREADLRRRTQRPVCNWFPPPGTSYASVRQVAEITPAASGTGADSARTPSRPECERSTLRSPSGSRSARGSRAAHCSD